MKIETENNNFNKKPSKRKYIIAAVCFVFLVIGVFAVAIIKWEPKPDPASERKIREAAAKQLNKEPNELTDEDFAKIMEFNLYETVYNYESDIYIPPWLVIELSDIRLLEKFTNLKLLTLKRIRLPQSDFPKWKKYLAKIGILKLQERQSLDLSPLKKLTNLKVLYITDCPNITDKQVKELQKALPNLKIVR